MSLWINGGNMKAEDVVIKWKDIKTKPNELYCWCVVIMKPSNYKECDKRKISYEDWIKEFGFQLAWWNNGKFWVDHVDVTDRVMLYDYKPKIILVGDDS